MRTNRKIILFELNEVPWKVLNYYCDRHPESHVARLRTAAHKYESVNTDQGHLSPWITWPTFHRGVNNTAHGISSLNQDLSAANAKYPPLWDILKRNGVRTAVFGSMHSAPAPADFRDYAFYVPDPFSSEQTASPAYIEPFQAFSLAMSRESARNVSTKVDLRSGLRVMAKTPQLGFRPGTFFRLGKQLLDERKRPWVKTRRRSYQVVLAWDVFLRQLQLTEPEFTTFFSNHVASTMHRYWAAAFPGDYAKLDVDPAWIETYKGEIDFTMGIFDGFLGELFEFLKAHTEYQLVVASSMGQASTIARQCESQLYIGDEKRFFAALGLGAEDYTHMPCMFPQFNIRVRPEKVEQFKEAVAQLIIDGQPLSYGQEDNGFFSLHLGHDNLKGNTVTFRGAERTFAEMGLDNVEIEDKSAATAYHIPQGILLVYDPRDLSAKPGVESIDSTAFTPNVLESFGIQLPDYMKLSPMRGLVAKAQMAAA